MSNFTDTDIHSLVAELLDPSEIIAYRPAIARALRSSSATLFLCQAIYWQRIAQKAGQEYFYKLRDAEVDEVGYLLPPSSASRQSWEWELGMGRSEQETARKLLESLNLLETKRVGVPPRLHYKVNLAEIANFLLKNQQRAGKSPFKKGDSNHLNGDNLPIQAAGMPPYNTEINTEITPKNTHRAAETAAADLYPAKNISNPNPLKAPAETDLDVDAGKQFLHLLQAGVIPPQNQRDLDLMAALQCLSLNSDEIKAAVQSVIATGARPYCSAVAAAINEQRNPKPKRYLAPESFDVVGLEQSNKRYLEGVAKRGGNVEII